MDGLFFGGFFVIWALFMLGGVGGFVLGIAALVSAARLPAEAFGPWWDNTRSAWMLGIGVSFAVPFGMLVTGIYWFTTGKPGYTRTGVVGRPFWVGPPKPAPPPAAGGS